VITFSTNGVKALFTRSIPRDLANPVDNDEADLEVDLDELDEDDSDGKKPKKAAKPKPKPKPTVDAATAAPGWYAHTAVKFDSPAPKTLVGVDPGQGSPFIFFQEGLTHAQLKKRHGEEYVLQPFGLSSKSYHHQIGTYGYNRKLYMIKKKFALKHPDRPHFDLALHSFKTSDGFRVRSSFNVQALHHDDLFALHGSRRLGKQMAGLKDLFWRRLSFSLQVRFPGRPVIAFGSAKVAPSRFRGSPSSPVTSSRAAFAKLFACISTPEYYTSQKYVPPCFFSHLRLDS